MTDDQRISFRLPPELKTWVETQAKRERRKTSDWIRLVLEEKRQTTVDKSRRRG